jgi:hypothetical protein
MLGFSEAVVSMATVRAAGAGLILSRPRPIWGISGRAVPKSIGRAEHRIASVGKVLAVVAAKILAIR